MTIPGKSKQNKTKQNWDFFKFKPLFNNIAFIFQTIDFMLQANNNVLLFTTFPAHA